MRGEQGRRLLIVVVLFFGLKVNAQDVTMKGAFLQDSLKIGQEINFWITASYPPEVDLLFPDSNYNFSPFEYVSKKYFPTSIANGLALDSTVYTLQSFEIDKVQFLDLKAIVLQGKDTSIFPTPTDSIFLVELAPIVTDTTSLKTNLDYQAVDTEFNFVLLYIVLAALFVLSTFLLILFGKRIVRYFKLKKLQREYSSFSNQFNAYLEQLKIDPTPDVAEVALSEWKKYQQKLDKRPFTTLTSKEILALDNTQELSLPLKSIDRMIYGKKMQEKVYQDFQQIEDYSYERYQRKIEEVKHDR